MLSAAPAEGETVTAMAVIVNHQQFSSVGLAPLSLDSDLWTLGSETDPFVERLCSLKVVFRRK